MSQMKGEHVGSRGFPQRERSPFLFSIVLELPGQGAEVGKINKYQKERFLVCLLAYAPRGMFVPFTQRTKTRRGSD